MRWFLINKENTVKPTTGGYRDHLWKTTLRNEAKNQCVYCAINESNFGGYRNFHVEHYRPRKHFPQLTNEFLNLFYSCAICNAFKGPDWPSEPDNEHNKCCYPDPSAADYSHIFSIDVTGIVTSKYLAGKYILERLYLNRPHLILLRRRVAISTEIRELIDTIEATIDPHNKHFREFGEHVLSAYRLLDGLALIAPYEPDDIKRPK